MRGQVAAILRRGALAMLALAAIHLGSSPAGAVDWGAWGTPTWPQIALPSFGGLPDCGAEGVIYDVVDRFGHVHDVQWHTGLKINFLDRIRETGYAPPTQHTVARRWCEASANLSNGRRPVVYYLIEMDRNFAGVGMRVTYCVAEYDYWHVYGESCRTVKAGNG